MGQQPAEHVIEQLRRCGSVVVAFSGGVDSAVVVAAAVRAVGPDAVLAAIADSPSLARGELADARETAAVLGVGLEVVATDEVSDPGYVANAGNRCYFCKHTVLTALTALAAERGFATVATGTHVDDRRAPHRPGLRAAAELSVVEPLAAAGLTKPMVRALAREWDLPVSDKPSMPCLASRIAVGVPVSIEALGLVERAEAALRRFLTEAGVPVADLRVRLLGDDFRVELDEGALDALDRSLEGELISSAAAVGLPGTGSLVAYRSGSVSDSGWAPRSTADDEP